MQYMHQLYSPSLQAITRVSKGYPPPLTLSVLAGILPQKRAQIGHTFAEQNRFHPANSAHSAQVDDL
jgi:hypothetical protein